MIGWTEQALPIFFVAVLAYVTGGAVAIGTNEEGVVEGFGVVLEGGQ